MIMIDEKLKRFRCRCSSKQNFPNNANKYGVKVLVLFDAYVNHTYSVEIYAGQQRERLLCICNEPADLVKNSSRHNTGRNKNTDNRFLDYELVNHFSEKKF